MNKVILLGRLTKDIELKETVSGKSYARVGLAVDRPFSKNKEVDFFNLVAWDKTAEMMSRYFEKGKRILVEGITAATFKHRGHVITAQRMVDSLSGKFFCRQGCVDKLGDADEF